MFFKILPFFLIFFLSACSVLDESIPVNATAFHIDKCKEVSAKVIDSDSRFTASRTFLSNELKVTVRDVKDGIILCDLVGKSSYTSYTGYAIAYNEEHDFYLSTKYRDNDPKKGFKYLVERMVDAHPICKDSFTYEANREYVACIERNSYLDRRKAIVYDLSRSRKYSIEYRKIFKDDENVVESLLEHMKVEQEEDNYNKCMADVNCKKKYYADLADYNNKLSKIKDDNNKLCMRLGKDITAKKSVLSSPEIIQSDRRGPYIFCLIKFSQSSLSGRIQKTLSVTGRVDNGTYQVN